jgi:hypothetical protein
MINILSPQGDGPVIPHKVDVITTPEFIFALYLTLA